MPEGNRSRALEYATLAGGLAFSAGVLGVTLLNSWNAKLLPDDPAGFLERYLHVQDRAGPTLIPLGFAVFLLCGADTSRASRLLGRRTMLRLASILAVIALALGTFATDPFEWALRTGELAGGPAILAAWEALAPWVWLDRVLALLLAGLLVAAHRAPLAGPETDQLHADRYRSTWVPPLFGETPALPSRQWRVLGLMVAASFFNAYDMALFSLALKQIQAGLAIEEAHLGVLGAAIRLGVVPGVAIVLFADTFGRRRTLFWTIAGYTFFTGATALSPDERTFAVCQFLARTFGAAEGTLAAVVVAEEIDPDQRGWALGVLGSLASLGVGLAWILFAFVEALPLGWRTLYLVGLGPLVVVAYLRRNLPETRRFENWRREALRTPSRADVLRPLASLVRAYPGRFAAVCSVIFLMSFSGQAAGFFFPKYLQDSHGLEPAQFTMLGAAIGSLALVASPIFGRLGDRLGRRPVAILFVLANPLTVIALYHSPGLVVAGFAAAAMLLADIGSDTNLGAFAKELFPTSYRSTADAARGVVGQLGGSLGLVCESLLFAGLGTHAFAISVLAVVGFAVPFIVARAFPETSGRALEEISPER